MNVYVGITDLDWVNSLQNANMEEINFWKPGGKVAFKALSPGELFLFKLHSPRDYIVGGGFFLNFSILPASLAWDAFGAANGADSFESLCKRVYKYKGTNHYSDPDPQIGCIILSTPFFFKESEWIAAPSDWKASIVQGKTYDIESPEGTQLFSQVRQRLKSGIVTGETSEKEKYGKGVLVKPRIGQGAFKVLITDAYQRRCAITGEKTLPVLEAAHIRPYSLDGPHEISNGLLLRRDFHTLYDRGYLTVSKDYTVEVSHRIKEDFGNGKVYYAHHGQKLQALPARFENLPDQKFLLWHNENIYLG